MATKQKKPLMSTVRYINTISKDDAEDIASRGYSWMTFEPMTKKVRGYHRTQQWCEDAMKRHPDIICAQTLDVIDGMYRR